MCGPVLSLIGACVAGLPAAGADTRAGTLVTNVASLQLRDTGGNRTLSSNAVTLTVAERLDVALASPGVDRVDVTPGGVAVPVSLTNRGNGQESFAIGATTADASVRVRLIAIDRDGDGRYDPASDVVLAGGRTPVIDAGASLSLLVLLDPATDPVTATTLAVTAQAVTGSGPAGTVFAGRGDAGGDAVTGGTQASATLDVPLGSPDPTMPMLVKSQSVRAPDGSATPVVGAVITYRLEARFPAAVAAVRIADPIPVGTAYLPGSLRLDAATLSDAGDGDAGRADAAGIAVDLGDIAAAGTRTVQFQVTIR